MGQLRRFQRSDHKWRLIRIGDAPRPTQGVDYGAGGRPLTSHLSLESSLIETSPTHTEATWRHQGLPFGQQSTIVRRVAGNWLLIAPRLQTSCRSSERERRVTR